MQDCLHLKEWKQTKPLFLMLTHQFEAKVCQNENVKSFHSEVKHILKPK